MEKMAVTFIKERSLISEMYNLKEYIYEEKTRIQLALKSQL